MASLDDGALQARFRAARDRAPEAARAAAEAMAAVMEQATKAQLSLSSHAPRTQTPAPPGAPPSLISGQLRRSVRRTSSMATGVASWETRVGGTTVYARIQELGGLSGPGHRTRLPPRPYLRPALAMSWGKLQEAAQAAFRRVTGV